MNQENKLTLEQEFKLTLYNKKLREMNDYHIKKYLTNTLKKMMIKDNVVKYSIKNLIN
uniref:Uncharacterized protein ycf18 n=1 Tax=Chondria sp. (in: red algae) TaxID=1982705 RepID=A0A1Z1MC65_9FLOR|nr:phycobilisome degradation protein [Chondria sp. (in: red algae)]